MYFPIWRFFRISLFVLSIVALLNLVAFCYNQSRFQKFLAVHYITWDDFPPKYTETLQAKDWDGLKTDAFDYQKAFPTPSTDDGATKIPRIIHFIWFRNMYDSRPEVTDIPATGSQAPRLCAEHNPSYEVKVWNATSAQELLGTHYSWFLPTYEAYKYPIQRIDAIKYFVLLHYGGVYMDMDVSCRRNLDPLLEFPAWFPEASPLGVNNDLMASRAQHPVVRLMVDNLKRRNKNLIFPYLTIFWSTGPQFTGDMLKKWFLNSNEGRFVPKTSKKDSDTGDWFVLPQMFYSEEFTFFGHSPGGTWHGDDVAVVLWFVAHPFIFWALVTSLLVGCCLVPGIYRKRNRDLWSRSQPVKLEAGLAGQ